MCIRDRASTTGSVSCNIVGNARAAASVNHIGGSTAEAYTTGRAPKVNTATRYPQRRAQTEWPRPTRSAASEPRRHNYTKAPIDSDNGNDVGKNKNSDTKKSINIGPRKGSAFKILFTNAFGLFTKLGDLIHMATNESPDIIVVVESKLSEDKAPKGCSDLEIPGYDSPYRRGRNANGGGIIVWVKTELAGGELEDAEKDGHEVLWFTVKWKKKDKDTEESMNILTNEGGADALANVPNAAV